MLLFATVAHSREAWVCMDRRPAATTPINVWTEGERFLIKCVSCSDAGVWNILEDDSDHILSYSFHLSDNTDNNNYPSRYTAYMLLEKRSGRLIEFDDNTSQIIMALGKSLKPQLPMNAEPPSLMHSDCIKGK
jgi:hypothetical protein